MNQNTQYWLVGRRIVEFYQHGAGRAEYGGQVLIKLSGDLSARFGKGYSVDNLENMRRFYTGFPKMLKISETLSRKSSAPDSEAKSEPGKEAGSNQKIKVNNRWNLDRTLVED